MNLTFAKLAGLLWLMMAIPGQAKAASLQCKSILKITKLAVHSKLALPNATLSFKDSVKIVLGAKNKISASSSPREAYETYMETRTEFLSPKNREALMKSLDRNHSVGLGWEPKTSVDAVTHLLTLKLPPFLMEGLGSRIVMVHEVEHLVQAAVSPRDFSRAEKSAEYRFNAEKAAMTSEASFLLSLSRSTRIEEINNLQKILDVNPLFSSNLKQLTEFIIEILNESLNVNSAKDYVKLQWDKGRYPEN